MKRHAWKACNRQNRFAGSNPVLSASFISVQLSLSAESCFFVFCILVVPHLRRGLWIMPSSQLAVPHRRLRLPLSSLFDENTTISRFHFFTISPHQSPETMLSPLISPLRQAESHELIIVHSLYETRLLDPMEQREERPSLLGLSRVVTEEDKVKPHLKTMERSD